MGSIDFSIIEGHAFLQRLGFQILLLAVFIDLLREFLRFVRGAHADFVEVLIRGAVAAAVLAAIPTAASKIASFVLSVSDSVGGSTVQTLNNAMSAAAGGFSCTPTAAAATTDASVLTKAMGFMSTAAQTVTFMMTPSGWLFAAGSGVILLLQVLKFVVIDVLWRVVFSLTVFMGVIAVPISFFKDFGGIAHFAKRVVSVALWPIVFNFLLAIVSSMFPGVLTKVAAGQVGMACNLAIEGGTVAAGAAAAGDGVLTALKFLAICIAIAFLLLKVPAISASLVGADDPGMGMVGAAIAAPMAAARMAGMFSSGGAAAAAGGASAAGAAAGSAIASASPPPGSGAAAGGPSSPG